MRAILFCLLLGLSAAARAAQPAPPAAKVVVLVTGIEHDKAAMALFQAQKLQAAGADVKLVFMGRAVVVAADLAGKIPDQRRQNAGRIKPDDPKRAHKERLSYALEKAQPVAPQARARFGQLKSAGVAILADGFSAAQMSLDDDLTAAGVPMSDATAPLDLTPFVLGGYQFISF